MQPVNHVTMHTLTHHAIPRHQSSSTSSISVAMEVDTQRVISSSSAANLLSPARSPFHCTTCQPCVSAYFDTFMQLHMMTIKNHPSSRLNSILGTNGVLDARIYRRLSIKWPYMHHHVQLWSLTDYHSIIGTTCATLSAMHSHLHILPHIVSISIPERMMLWRSALFPFRFHAVIAPSSIVHRCKITWRYWHKFWNRINDS